MADQTPQEYRALTREDLDELAGEALPERAAMSLINANIAAPVNAAVALNALSDNSTAIANAEQTANITQTTLPVTTTERRSRWQTKKFSSIERSPGKISTNLPANLCPSVLRCR